MWETTHIDNPVDWHIELNGLLAVGWEPFAVYGVMVGERPRERMWLRRKVTK